MEFQRVARGRNSTFDNPCVINRSIGVQRHGVNQFLASRNIQGRFKQTGLRCSSRQFLSLRCGWGRCGSPHHQGTGPQIILMCLIMRRTPNGALVDRVDFATRYRCLLDRLPASRLLPPRSGLERSDFVQWPDSEVAERPGDFRFLRYSGLVVLTASLSESVESPGGISPPGAPKTVREPLESHGSRCSTVGTRATGFTSSTGSSCCQIASGGPWPRVNNAAPSVQPHYRAFIPTTGHSAPVLRIGTLVLAVLAA